MKILQKYLKLTKTLCSHFRDNETASLVSDIIVFCLCMSVCVSERERRFPAVYLPLVACQPQDYYVVDDDDVTGREREREREKERCVRGDGARKLQIKNKSGRWACQPLSN